MDQASPGPADIEEDREEMSETVNGASPIPVRVQLRTILLEEIRKGTFLPNQRVPSERVLAQRYRASRTSVREAIAELITEGVLFRAGGRGTFVAECSAAPAKPASQLNQVGFWISEEIFHFVQAGYARILTGVEEVCRDNGYTLRFHSVHGQADALDLSTSAGCGSAGVAGNVVTGGVGRAVLEKLQQLGSPLVIVDPLLRSNREGVDCVRIDHARGTREAVKPLVELGHTEIGFIGLPGSVKYDAYWQALEEFGLPYRPRNVQFLEMPDLAPSILAGYQCMNRLLKSQTRPTALVALNDYVALGALEALSIAGVAVPEELSVVGFDDIGEGGISLTTVKVDLVETGRIAARTLLERLQHPGAPARQIIVPVDLVTRRSTTPARAADPRENMSREEVLGAKG